MNNYEEEYDFQSCGPGCSQCDPKCYSRYCENRGGLKDTIFGLKCPECLTRQLRVGKNGVAVIPEKPISVKPLTSLKNRSFKGYYFTISGYYNVRFCNECTVLVKHAKMKGVLRNGDNSKFIVNANLKNKISKDVVFEHPAIFMYHTVFEDYVHEGDGILLTEELTSH